MPDPYGTPELFDLAPADRGYRTETRQAAPRAVAHGNCPCCAADRVGLIRVGDHLVWKPHHLVTYGRDRPPCRASGVRLCDAPAKPPVGGWLPREDRARCPHTAA